jgi:hypothetical protein
MILNDVYELQLEGRFENKEEALSYIGERYIPKNETHILK